MSLRIIFCGTPQFAVPSLQAMLDDPDIEVLGVLTQPDRPAGRGQKLTPPPVKVLALQHQLPVYQPTRLRKEPEIIDWLRAQAPDYLVTAAFGQILSQEVLDIPRLGTVNVHASLLPEYRGPNPIQWAILNGDAVAGVTTMFTELSVDTGPMLLKAQTPIQPNEDAAHLLERLAQLGAEILPQSLHQYAQGTLQAQPQDHDAATHAPKLTREDAWIDWSWSAQKIHNKVRGQQPWPGAVTRLGDVELKIIETCSPEALPPSVQNPPTPSGNPGHLFAIMSEGVWVQTGSGPLLIQKVQPPGKPKMNAKDWANGFLKPEHPRTFDPPLLSV